VKVLVNKANDLVVGFHICAPNAGEVTQGVGIAFKCGMTKKMLDSCIGIHPTVAEDCIGLDKTKEEFPDVTKTGC
jgi:pyruvate/2-oxoglutarate dehydrogenase complex dihydrolipoamide dehydrogenase (E3) component